MVDLDERDTMDISKNYTVEVLVDRALTVAGEAEDWTSFQRYQALMLAALVKQNQAT